MIILIKSRGLVIDYSSTDHVVVALIPYIGTSSANFLRQETRNNTTHASISVALTDHVIDYSSTDHVVIALIPYIGTSSANFSYDTRFHKRCYEKSLIRFSSFIRSICSFNCLIISFLEDFGPLLNDQECNHR